MGRPYAPYVHNVLAYGGSNAVVQYNSIDDVLVSTQLGCESHPNRDERKKAAFRGCTATGKNFLFVFSITNVDERSGGRFLKKMLLKRIFVKNN